MIRPIAQARPKPVKSIRPAAVLGLSDSCARRSRTVPPMRVTVHPAAAAREPSGGAPSSRTIGAIATTRITSIQRAAASGSEVTKLDVDTPDPDEEADEDARHDADRDGSHKRPDERAGQREGQHRSQDVRAGEHAGIAG